MEDPGDAHDYTKELERKLKVAREALEFYATRAYEDVYSRSVDADGNQIIYESEVLQDAGNKARQALKEIGDGID